MRRFKPSYGRRRRPNRRYRRKNARSKRKPRTVRVKGTVRIKDTTVTRTAPKREQVRRMVKGTAVIPPYVNYTSSASVKAIGGGVQFQSTAASTDLLFGYMLFDPSGTIASCKWSGIISPASDYTSLQPQTMSSWSTYAALYQKYRVTKITLKFTANVFGSYVSSTPFMYLRWVDDYSVTVPNDYQVANEVGWVRKQFTNDSSTFTYTIYPKVMKFTDTTGVTSTDSRYPAKMPFTDITTPSSLYGLQFGYSNPGSWNISMDVKYHVQFKDTVN